MDAHPDNSLLPIPQPDFIERRGGWILSVCLHVILFSGLLIYRPVPDPRLSETPEPIRVMLSEPEPTSLPVLTPSVPTTEGTPTGAPDGAASGGDSGAAMIGPPVEAQGPDPISNPTFGPTTGAAKSGIAPAPTPEAKSLIEAPLPPAATALAPPALGSTGAVGGLTPLPGLTGEALLSYKKRGEELRLASAAEARTGSTAVAGRLGTVRAEVKAQKALYGAKDEFSARGAAQGAVRELDMSGVPEGEAQKVLGRYGIKILITQASGSGDGVFLNKAKTSNGQFVSKFGKGTYRVFRYGTAAVGRMVQLEEEALRAQKLDPNKSRVARVVFGIVSTGSGYDLGVKSIEAYPVNLPAKATGPDMK